MDNCVKMKFGMFFLVNGCLKLIEVSHPQKLHTFCEKNIGTEVAAYYLDEEWRILCPESVLGMTDIFYVKQGVLTYSSMCMLLSKGLSFCRSAKTGKGSNICSYMPIRMFLTCLLIKIINQ